MGICFESTLEKRNRSKLKINQRTSLWMHLSPTTIRDLIIFYFKTSVGVISSYFLSKNKDKPSACIPTHFLSKIAQLYPSRRHSFMLFLWFRCVVIKAAPWITLGSAGCFYKILPINYYLYYHNSPQLRNINHRNEQTPTKCNEKNR